MLRRLATAAVVSLVLAACGPAPGSDEVGGGPSPDGDVPTDAPTEGATDGGAGDGGGGAGGDAGGSDGSGSGDEAPPGEDTDGGDAAPTASEPATASLTPVDDLGGVGANGRAYLRPDRPRMIVEIDVQEGARAGQDAVEHLQAVLRRHADKPDGVQLAGGETFASQRDAWTRDDLRAAADQHRDLYSTDDTTVLYVLYVNGGFHRGGEETSAIGVAYNASEIALFPDRWSGVGSLVGADRSIERAVLVHELGHALGLVNLTYRSDLDHEDPEHPGHSSHRGSVMFWAVETTLIGQVFDGPPPDDFDDADRADLEGLRTGRY